MIPRNTSINLGLGKESGTSLSSEDVKAPEISVKDLLKGVEDLDESPKEKAPAKDHTESFDVETEDDAVKTIPAASDEVPLKVLDEDVEDVQAQDDKGKQSELAKHQEETEIPEDKVDVAIINEVKEKDGEIDAPDIFEEFDDLDSDQDDEEDEPINIPQIHSVTALARLMRNEGFKLSVFNVKDTLIRYLELFNERKVARTILDADSSTFYEIHAPYIPGGVLYQFLTALGFKPLHPTDLNEDYHKDMRYDVAMSNGSIAINVFGGLQQHSPSEETVIRNLYDWERKRFGLVNSSGVMQAAVESIAADSDFKITCGLLLAAIQSFTVDKPSLASSFFSQAMKSKGLDQTIEMLSSAKTTYENQPSYVEISDFSSVDKPDPDEDVTDEERARSLEDDTVKDLVKYDR